MDMYNKGVKAASRYLELKGYDDVEVLDGYLDIVCKYHEEGLVFVHVSVDSSDESGFGLETIKDNRKLCETEALQYLSSHCDEISDGPVRFDEVNIHPVGGDKALIRHHINALTVEE